MEIITIKKNMACFAEYKRLLQAVCKDETKENIYNIVYSSGKELVVTDEHRIHMIINQELIFDGFEHDTSYKVIAETAKEIILQKTDIKKFPDYGLIIPKDDILTKCHDVNISKKDTTGLSLVYCGIYEATKTVINIAYLEDLGDDCYTLYYHKDTKEKPLFFQNKNFKAVVMSIKQS